MSKPLLFAAAVALCFATADPARAQAAAPASAPASAAKKELVARLLQLQKPGIDSMARQLAQQPALQMLQQASAALQRVPPERREALAADIQADVRKYADEASAIAADRAWKLAPSTIGPVFEERFSEDELTQLIAILESPVNRKFQAAGPDMQRALGEKLIAETRGEIEPKVRALEQTVSKRLNAATPAASAPATAKPAAPAKKP